MTQSSRLNQTNTPEPTNRQSETEQTNQENQNQPTPALSSVVSALQSGKVAGAQRKTLVQRAARQYGNREVQRMVASLRQNAEPAQAQRHAEDQAEPVAQRHIADQPQLASNGGEAQREMAETGQVQRGFFGRLWSGIKSVASSIGSGLSAAGRWVVDRLGDAAQAVMGFIRSMPARMARFAQTVMEGMVGVVSFIPEAIQRIAQNGFKGFGDWLWDKAKSGAAWAGTLLMRVLDNFGVPEAAELIMHIISKATPLTGEEINAAKGVLGENAINWGQVKVAEGGFLGIIFRANGGRAFTTFHTINIPSTGAHSRTNLSIMVHELTHVYQYEKVGSLYIAQAIHAQNGAGYDYGNLEQQRNEGKHFANFNREQQAQMCQDYYLTTHGQTAQFGATQAQLEPFVEEARVGAL
jgi:hypothetical protein